MPGCKELFPQFDIARAYDRISQVNITIFLHG